MGMATAWVTGGRVVLRKTANPGYGVELRVRLRGEATSGRNTKCAVDLANGHRRGSGGYDRSGSERVAVR